MSKTPAPALSASSSAPAAPFSVMTAGTYQGGEDPLVSKLGTQLGIIHPLPAPPVSRSVVGLFALFFLQAYVAKLETSMSAVASKLETKLYGYNDTLPILLSKIFSTHCFFSPTTDDFEVLQFIVLGDTHELYCFLDHKISIGNYYLGIHGELGIHT
ncbi:uncharacterized protein LOC8084525 isoform X3 [Sorghum bicolor]|uniref:uncharacterized protein LOC8084525 isoform X3 n=1 Tax=Sorghum bicolor TaxID=4558 RepID=UPI000B424B64|nr:uncharacterized protein LOC8084525 isoform X3 [Sorghum bicolor]XP_021313978.1 uncharacterized protein LOC8084525 isoform X3 [Sorghum bicolor]XP_021313979.1 uncharacterized protein LOC8084525 isoform X3 [Sorghum bicolor]|eukprot:XP_021313977.1 uncharacterized protein LOC8084525 isoform X3 [Sorghum bicolor]